MLYTYRRHRKFCPHLREGRRYLRCGCPVWVDGRLKGERIHSSLGTSDWQKALQIVRDWEAEGTSAVSPPKAEPLTTEQAWSRFLTDLEVRKLHPSTIRKYRLVKKQMNHFAQAKGLRFLKEIDTDALDEFRSMWKDAALSASKKLERLRAFFRFSQKRKWLSENPAIDLRAPKILARPTLPFTAEEMLRLLAAIDKY